MFRQTQRSFLSTPRGLVRVLIYSSSALLLAPLMIGLGPRSRQAASPAVSQHESVVTRFSLITTIAGNGIASGSGDGSQAVEATLNTPAGLAIDTAGQRVHIADAFQP